MQPGDCYSLDCRTTQRRSRAPRHLNVIKGIATGLEPLNFVDVPPVDPTTRIAQFDNVALVNWSIALEETFPRLDVCFHLSAPLVRLALVVNDDHRLDAQ